MPTHHTKTPPSHQPLYSWDIPSSLGSSATEVRNLRIVSKGIQPPHPSNPKTQAGYENCVENNPKKGRYAVLRSNSKGWSFNMLNLISIKIPCHHLLKIKQIPFITNKSKKTCIPHFHFSIMGNSHPSFLLWQKSRNFETKTPKSSSLDASHEEVPIFGSAWPRCHGETTSNESSK